jgi:hypothetical protein
MFPLSWLLLAWLGFLGIFILVSLITLFTHLRFGVASFVTYLSTLAFIGVSTVAILLAGNYLMHVDWTQTVDLSSTIGPLFDIPSP